MRWMIPHWHAYSTQRRRDRRDKRREGRGKAEIPRPPVNSLVSSLRFPPRSLRLCVERTFLNRSGFAGSGSGLWTGVSIVLLSLAAAGLLIPAEAPYIGPVFTDVTEQAGIRFVHNSGRAGKKYLPETMGSGCAFFDADGDGWPDILLINSKDWTPRGRRSLPALYRNNRNGTFTDITAGS